MKLSTIKLTLIAAAAFSTALFSTVSIASNAISTVSGRIDELNNYLANLVTLQGSFKQQVKDSSGRMIERSSGKLYIARNSTQDNSTQGKFRWDTITPYPQQIIGDGNKIWIYDPDLEQVTVRSQGDSLANTPAALLTESRGVDDIEKNFIITSKENWVVLTPRKQEGGFEKIELWLGGGRLKMVEVVDSLGQQTSIEFINLNYNKPLSSDLFIFTPPAGVDVVGE